MRQGQRLVVVRLCPHNGLKSDTAPCPPRAFKHTCADECISSHDIFGLAQKLSLVADEIVAG